MVRRHPLVSEALLSAAAAASIAAMLAWLGPPGTDLAAHAYQRTLFLEHGFTLWNNFWYAGRYSFVTYSLIYYPLAAALGIRLLAVATIALASLAFAVILWREWGPTTRWSSRSFAVVWAGIVLSAAFPFALGIARVLRYVFAVYLAAMIVAYLVPSAVGENVARMRYAAIPVAVLIFSLRRWKPLVPGLAVIALAVSWNITPLVFNFANASADATTSASAWTGAIAFLKAHAGPDTRVESVDTTGHWGATYLADANIPLARGWFRQDDFPQNQVLYSKLGPRAYLRWLRGLGVGYVVLATAAPLDYSSRAEARLIESGRAGLRLVYE